jgi:hypothetical protein
MATEERNTNAPANIIDIRREELDESLLKLMLKSLEPGDGGAKTLPTLLLYNGRPWTVTWQKCDSRKKQRLA